MYSTKILLHFCVRQLFSPTGLHNSKSKALPAKRLNNSFPNSPTINCNMLMKKRLQNTAKIMGSKRRSAASKKCFSLYYNNKVASSKWHKLQPHSSDSRPRRKLSSVVGQTQTELRRPSTLCHMYL